MKISNKKSSWINDARFDPQVHHGFVYLIVNLVNDRKYIGRKYTHITSKGRIVSESNWRNYWGSCKSLNADIVKYGFAQFERHILGAYLTRQDTNYAELETQFALNVLRATLPNGEREFYNGFVGGKFFASSFKSVKSE